MDANELSGLCYVGNNDWRALLGYSVAPHTVLLLVGILFILIGFFGVCQVRRQLHSDGAKEVSGSGLLANCTSTSQQVSKLERLMVKIGIFSVLYVVPAVCCVLVDVYHTIKLREWETFTNDCYERDSCAHDRPDRPRVRAVVAKRS